MIDIAIIGGGPAGLTAGLYAARGGANAVLYEEMFVGGQAAKTERIENLPGFPDGLDGFEVGALLEAQAARFGLDVRYDGVSSLDLSGGEKRIVLCSGEVVTAKAVILAMGASPKKLGLDGEERLSGRGVSYCATCDGAFFKGKDVIVVGGGDTALADAIYLAKLCGSVTVVHRRDALRAAMALQNAARAQENIRFALECVPEALVGEAQAEGLTVRNVRTNETKTLPASGVFVAVGIEPRTSLVAGQVVLSGDGAIATTERMETSIPGVYAVGDVRATPLRQVVTACADGAVAATEALGYIGTLG